MPRRPEDRRTRPNAVHTPAVSAKTQTAVPTLKRLGLTEAQSMETPTPPHGIRPPRRKKSTVRACGQDNYTRHSADRRPDCHRRPGTCRLNGRCYDEWRGRQKRSSNRSSVLARCQGSIVQLLPRRVNSDHLDNKEGG